MKKIIYITVFLFLSYGAQAQWSLSGNAAVSTNFLGTTNAQPLCIRVNNSQRMLLGIHEKNALGLNLTSPQATLHIHRSDIIYDESVIILPPGGEIGTLSSSSTPIQQATFLLTNHISGTNSGFRISFNGTGVRQQLETEGKFELFAANSTGLMLSPQGKLVVGRMQSYNNAPANYQLYVDSTFYAARMTGKRLCLDHHEASDWTYAFHVATNRDLTKAMAVTNPAGNEVFRVMGNGICYSKYLVSEQIKVTLSASSVFWYDHVFAPEYQLTPLKDVEQFVKTHRHLPDIPSEKEVLANGLNLADMDALLLKKVEELTLYTIDQQKQIEELKGLIESLQNQLDSKKGGE
jgi:hypothetical protein